MASGPVSSWSDSNVIQYNLLRWDHQLLKTHGYPVADYQKAHDQFTRLTNANKPNTRAAIQATYVAEKRQLIAKLLELRLAAGQALRIAGASITTSSEAAEKARVAILKEQMRTHKRMLKILGKQAEHIEDLTEVGKVLGAAEDGEFVANAPAADDVQIGTGSSDDHLRPAAKAAAAPKAKAAPEAKAAPKAKAAAGPDAEITECPVCTTPVKGKRGLTVHQRRCPDPGWRHKCDAAAEGGEKKRRRRSKADEPAGDAAAEGGKKKRHCRHRSDKPADDNAAVDEATDDDAAVDGGKETDDNKQKEDDIVQQLCAIMDGEEHDADSPKWRRTPPVTPVWSLQSLLATGSASSTSSSSQQPAAPAPPAPTAPAATAPAPAPPATSAAA